MGIIMKNGIPYGGGGGGGEQTEIPDWLLPAEYDSSVTRYTRATGTTPVNCAYRLDDYVLYNKNIYRCIDSYVDVGEAFNSAKWTIVPDIFKELSLKSGGKDNENIYTGIVETMAAGSNKPVASGYESHAEGYKTVASGFSSHAECNQTTASGHSSHAEGSHTEASGDESHAEGFKTEASGTYSHAEGDSTKATMPCCHAEGRQTIASKQCAHAEGFETEASEEGAHAEGRITIASGYGSHAEGRNTTASGDSSHAEGAATIASGICSHAEGSDCRATYNQTHAGGNRSVASANQAFAHGILVTASNKRSTAFGISNKEVLETQSANAYTVFSVGNGTIKQNPDADPEDSFAQYIKDVPSNAFEVRSDGTVVEGSNTATGPHSHAEGSGTTASGENSHAEGAGNTASGWDAHAEGAWCSASGTCSHAEGNATHAEGENAHSGGYASFASASNAFSHGTGTVASNANQASFGAYNSQVSSTTSPSSYTMFSIGNGADGDHRSNAFEVRSDGAAYLNNNEKIVTNVKVPDAPAADGTYTLKCTVVSGVPTYSWVAD